MIRILSLKLIHIQTTVFVQNCLMINHIICLNISEEIEPYYSIKVHYIKPLGPEIINIPYLFQNCTQRTRNKCG